MTLHHAALRTAVLALALAWPALASSGSSTKNAEQLVHDGRDSFGKADYTQAKRSLEKAVALCAREDPHAPSCAALTLEASFLLGKIYEDQNDLPQAMTAFQRVAEREADGRVKLKDEQKAYAQQAIARLRPKLGQVIVAQKGKRGCQQEVNWLLPGNVLFRVNGSEQAVSVKAGGEVHVGSCE